MPTAAYLVRLLIKHALAGDARAVCLVLRECYPHTIDAYNASGDTALLAVTRKRRADAARLLLEAGADPDVRHKHLGIPPLRVALDNDDMESVRLFIDGGCAVDDMCRDGLTALHAAVAASNEAAFDLMDTPHVVAIGDVRDGKGRSLLATAAGVGAIELSDKLLDRKGKVDTRDMTASTPLLSGAGSDMYTSTCVVSSLWQAGGAHTARDNRHRTALHRAAAAGNATLCWKLMGQPYGLSAVDMDCLGNQPLYYAALHGHSDAARCLLTRGGVDAGNHRGDTALLAAVAGGHYDTADVLLRVGDADPNVRSGGSPLLAACRLDGGGRMVQLLCDFGANPGLDGRLLLEDGVARGVVLQRLRVHALHPVRRPLVLPLVATEAAKWQPLADWMIAADEWVAEGLSAE